MKRRWVILIVALVIAVTYLGIRKPAQSGSIFSAGPNGTRAFFLLLQKEGFTVSPWLYPFLELDSATNGKLLFVVNPDDVGDLKALQSWIEAGNRVVWVANPFTGQLNEAIQKLGFSTESTERYAFEQFFDALLNEKTAYPVVCSEKHAKICSGVKEISGRTEVSLLANRVDPQAVAIRSGDTPIALYREMGKGDIFFLLDDSPILNKNIDRDDNLRLLYQLAMSNHNILFDEFHHGFVAPTPAEQMPAVGGMWLMFCFILFLLAFWVSGRLIRLVEPAPEPVMVSANSVEFSAALGLLYRDYEITQVLRYYLQAWEERLVKKSGLMRQMSPAGGDTGSILSRLEQEGRCNAEQVSSIQKNVEYLKNNGVFSEKELDKAINHLEASIKEIL